MPAITSLTSGWTAPWITWLVCGLCTEGSGPGRTYLRVATYSAKGLNVMSLGLSSSGKMETPSPISTQRLPAAGLYSQSNQAHASAGGLGLVEMAHWEPPGASQK